jgi:biotin carboxylase
MIDGRVPVPLTIFCIATYRKGDEFLRECHRQGCRVLLLTEEKLRDADWPREAVAAFYYLRRDMPADDLRKGIAHVGRTERIDRIVALDDFDVELAAMLREYLRIPGMGETTARAFRDKLAMRGRARSAGIPCPDFVHVLNHDAINEWISRVPSPWVMKPRSQAASVGIKKLHTTDALWRAIDELGDAHADYLLEQFIAGDVYHVDSILFGGEPQFAMVSRYGAPPMQVAHEGGIFVTQTLPDTDAAATPLREINARVLHSFGLRLGVSHTEFIRSAEGDWHFLETSARVGGAYIVDMVEAATGINLWREWARVEIAGEDGSYELPASKGAHAGIVLSLARQEHPDTSGYTAPEIVYRIKKRHHVGVILASPRHERVSELIEEHANRFYGDFHAFAPAPDRPIE